MNYTRKRKKRCIQLYRKSKNSKCHYLQRENGLDRDSMDLPTVAHHLPGRGHLQTGLAAPGGDLAAGVNPCSLPFHYGTRSPAVGETRVWDPQGSCRCQVDQGCVYLGERPSIYPARCCHKGDP